MTLTTFRQLQPGDVITSLKTARSLTVIAKYDSHIMGERDGQQYAVMACQAKNYFVSTRVNNGATSATHV